MEVGDRIDEWVNQCVRGVLSEKDRIELLRWLEAAPEHEKQFREMLRIAMRVSAVGQWSELDDIQQRTWDKITPFIERRRKKLYMWGTRIASVIIVMVGVALIWQNGSDQEIGTMQVSNVLQVESGSPKAILVTSAGEKIALMMTKLIKWQIFRGLKSFKIRRGVSDLKTVVLLRKRKFVDIVQSSCQRKENIKLY